MKKLIRAATRIGVLAIAVVFLQAVGLAQETDITQTPNAANAGIKKSLTDQIGQGRGDIMTPDSSAYIIARDPFRAIARGRQLFQRKFTVAQGVGPRTGDGVGDIETDGSLGAGLSDSCASCHGRPQGAAGFGGDVFTRPSSRDAPHLFGLGLVEMLGDEITWDLRALRSLAMADAVQGGSPVTVSLESKGIDYGSLTAFPDGSVDTSEVDGVDADLRVRPFFAQGGTISIREFVVGAFNAEMGLESFDPDLATAVAGGTVVTPSGMLLDGSLDTLEAPPAAHVFDDPDLDGVIDEIPQALVDHLEFYLLNYFKPAVRSPETSQLTAGRDGLTFGGAGFGTSETDASLMSAANKGLKSFDTVGCTSCHIPDLTIDVDRRVADVETRYEADAGNPFNNLFATATGLFTELQDVPFLPTLKPPVGDSFVVTNFFGDFKRHDLGSGFWEKNFDGTIQREFITEPLWGVGSTGPYGHDGRSPTLEDVILRHGGEAQAARDAFAALNKNKQEQVLEFLDTLVLFSPPSTASNLNPTDEGALDYPVNGHGSIDLAVLFNVPGDKE